MRSTRYVMALCAVATLTLVGCEKNQIIYAGPTSPSDVAKECGDGKDNNDPEDKLADRDDPGCSYPQGYYDPNDDDETDGPSGPPAITTTTPPGVTTLTAVCNNGVAHLTWSPVTGGVHHWDVYHHSWTDVKIPPVRVAK